MFAAHLPCKAVLRNLRIVPPNDEPKGASKSCRAIHVHALTLARSTEGITAVSFEAKWPVSYGK